MDIASQMHVFMLRLFFLRVGFFTLQARRRGTQDPELEQADTYVDQLA